MNFKLEKISLLKKKSKRGISPFVKNRLRILEMKSGKQILPSYYEILKHNKRVNEIRKLEKQEEEEYNREVREYNKQLKIIELRKQIKKMCEWVNEI